MKKSFFVVAFFTATLVFLFPIKASAEECYERIYRVYNPNSGEHFYTSSVDERIMLVKAGWNDEGLAWAAPESSGTPVYRLYSEGDGKNGDHHYTIDPAEKDWLISLGWKDEGILCYSAESKNRIPLYRNYNPNATTGAHNYTRDSNEYAVLNDAGWNDEGICWYALDRDTRYVLGTNHAYASFETEMTLNGMGDGYHSKIVLTDVTGARAVSFGIQYSYNLLEGVDYFGHVEDIKTNCAFLVENVMAKNTEAGKSGKEYTFVRDANIGQTYRINLSWYEDNTLRFYVDGEEIWHTKSTLEKPFYFSIEGSAMHNGDTIDANFSDALVLANEYEGCVGFLTGWNDSYADFFGLDVSMTQEGSSVTEETPMFTNGHPSQHCSFSVTGTADINTAVNGEICPVTNKAWDWDTSFYALEPRTNTTQHPLSAVATISQARP